jgi:16S rRNA C1402 (ribose-2'-O) methylase RsmI
LACASRDLTKRGELHVRGPLSEIQARLGAMTRITGEWTVCVGGASGDAQVDGLSDAQTALVRAMVDAGMSPRAVRDLVSAATDASKKELYSVALEQRKVD